MTTATEMTESVQDGVLKAIEVGQRLAVEAVGAAASTIDGVIPTRTSAVATPWAEGLMSPKELIETTFRFTERVLESQRSFLTELVTITTPATPSSNSSKKPATA